MDPYIIDATPLPQNVAHPHTGPGSGMQAEQNLVPMLGSLVRHLETNFHFAKYTRLVWQKRFTPYRSTIWLIKSTYVIIYDTINYNHAVQYKITVNKLLQTCNIKTHYGLAQATSIYNVPLKIHCKNNCYFES